MTSAKLRFASTSTKRPPTRPSGCVLCAERSQTRSGQLYAQESPQWGLSSILLNSSGALTSLSASCVWYDVVVVSTV